MAAPDQVRLCHLHPPMHRARQRLTPLSLPGQFGGADPVLERAFRGHTGAVNALVFNPNMRQLISGGEDGSLLVWHFKPSLRAYRFTGHKVRAWQTQALWGERCLGDTCWS